MDFFLFLLALVGVTAFGFALLVLEDARAERAYKRVHPDARYISGYDIERHRSDVVFSSGVTICLFGCLAILIFLIVAPIVYLASSGEVAGLRSQHDNLPILQQAVERYRVYSIEGRNALPPGVVTDLAYQGAATKYTDAVSDYRNAIVRYNKTLQSLRAQNSLVGIGAVTRNVPRGYEPIKELP